MSHDFFFCAGEHCEQIHSDINKIRGTNEELGFLSCGICGASMCQHHAISRMTTYPTNKQDFRVIVEFSKPICSTCSVLWTPKIGVIK